MGGPASGYITKLLAEVRDPQGMATTRARVLQIISRCQQQINASLDDVVVTASFNVSPSTQIYSISQSFPDCVRILSVRDPVGRDLYQLSERADIDATWLNSGWFTEVGSQLLSWGTIGRDLFMLRPGIRLQQTVTVRYTQVTPTLAIEADDVILPDEDSPPLDYLAALLVRMKSRDFDGLDKDFERFKTTMGALREIKR